MSERGKPTRIQRKRTKGWKMPPNTVYVGRPTKWGNPYRAGKPKSRYWPDKRFRTPAEAVELFGEWLMQADEGQLKDEVVLELRGKNLACWCPLDQPCHADVLLEIANL
jgi:hypothetical protein